MGQRVNRPRRLTILQPIYHLARSHHIAYPQPWHGIELRQTAQHDHAGVRSQHRNDRLFLTIVDKGLIDNQPALSSFHRVSQLAHHRLVEHTTGRIVGIAQKDGVDSRSRGRKLPKDLFHRWSKTVLSSRVDVLNRTPCVHQRAGILFKRGSDNERGLNGERARHEMNQFCRTVADKDHVWIDAALLRQSLPELPTIGIRIVHDLFERRANRATYHSGRTQRVDVGAKIYDLVDGNVLLVSDLVDVPAMSGLRHPFTSRSHPMPNRTPVRLVQSISVSAIPM